MEQLELIAPSVEWESDYRAFVEEFYAIEGLFARRAGDDFAEFIRQLEREAVGEGLADEQVPCSTFWLVRDGVRIVGASRLRHRLTPKLEVWGGHIGYNVRPSEWRRGYGTRLLALTLDRARARGMLRVVLMCAADNTASRRIIESSGGALECESIIPDSGKPITALV